MPRHTQLDNIRPQYIQLFEQPDTTFEITLENEASARNLRLELYSIKNELTKLREYVALRKELRERVRNLAQEKGVTSELYFDRTYTTVRKRNQVTMTNPFRPLQWQNEERDDDWVRLHLTLLKNMETKQLRVQSNKLLIVPLASTLAWSAIQVKNTNTYVPFYAKGSTVTTQDIERAQQKPYEEAMRPHTETPVEEHTAFTRDKRQEDAVMALVEGLLTPNPTMFHRDGAKVGPYASNASNASGRTQRGPSEASNKPSDEARDEWDISSETPQSEVVICLQCNYSRPDSVDQCPQCKCYDIVEDV